MSASEITNKRIHAIEGLTLADWQREIAGLVLDLFQGKSTASRLRRFTEDAAYLDAFANAHGRDEIAGQLYGIPIVMKSSVTLAHLVTKATDDLMEMRMLQLFHFGPILAYQEVKFSTVVQIELRDKMITKLTDRPEGDLPSDAVTKALRNLNSVGAPKFLPYPTNDEEDQKWWDKHVGPEARPEQVEREAEQGGPEGRRFDEPSKRG